MLSLADGSIILYLIAAGGGIVLATLLCVVLAHFIFPDYWVLGILKSKDIYTTGTNYYVGTRKSLREGYLKHFFKGVDANTRRWSLKFLAIWLLCWALFSVCIFVIASPAPVLNTTAFNMHKLVLNELPLLKKHNLRWNIDQDSPERQKLLELAQNEQSLSPSERAQLHLLLMYGLRNTHDGYSLFPDDQLIIDQAEQAAFLKTINALEPTTDTALMLALFYIGNHQYSEALKTLEPFLNLQATADKQPELPLIFELMLAHVLILNQQNDLAATTLQQLFSRNYSPEESLSRAMLSELFAEIMIYDGHTDKAQSLLDQAATIYADVGAHDGLARVRLYMAMIALLKDEPALARHNLAYAESLAWGLNDGFTQAMIQLFKATEDSKL